MSLIGSDNATTKRQSKSVDRKTYWKGGKVAGAHRQSLLFGDDS